LGEQQKAALAASRPPVKHVLLSVESVNRIRISASYALLNFIGVFVRVSMRAQPSDEIQGGHKAGVRG
jgi:hypothetical protein